MDMTLSYDGYWLCDLFLFYSGSREENGGFRIGFERSNNRDIGHWHALFEFRRSSSLNDKGRRMGNSPLSTLDYGFES